MDGDRTGNGVAPGRHVARRLVAALAAVILGAMPAIVWTSAASAQTVQIAAGRTAAIKVAKGKPKTLKTSDAFYEIVIGDPAVANVTPLTDRSFYVLGNELGTTAIALFDENKQIVGTIDIEVTLDTASLAGTIREAVPGANIRVSSANGQVVLSGSAPDAVAAEKAKRIAARFSADEEVINSVDITSSQQVQLNVRFVEINRQVGQNIGARYGANFAEGFNGRNVILDPGELLQAAAGEAIGRFLSNGLSIDVAIKALEDRGVARRLAEPNLVARSGQTASFLAGGEFPIPVSGGEDKIAIEYKKFGVGLEFTPTVLKDGLISLDIRPEVSSIDPSSSYNIGDISVPGFVVRRAQTSVDLKSGQSFMIAGLLQTQNDTTNSALPGISRVPVLGALFSSKAYQRRETDLVIIITPHLVKPIDPSKKVATPFDQTTPPNAVDFFLGHADEVKVGARSATAMNGAPAASGAGHFLELN